MITDGSLVDSIEYKREKVVSEPEYHLVRRKKMEDFLDELSVSCYEDGDDEDFSTRASYTSEFDHMDEELRENMGDAWDYARENIDDIPDHNDLITVNHLLRYGTEPDFDMLSGDITRYYRDKNVRITGCDDFHVYCPPEPERIYQELEGMKERLEGLEEEPDRSSYAHLLTVMIQPFQDANKRTAAIVQNAMLYNSDSPMSVIPHHEKLEYKNKLMRAMDAERKGERKGKEHLFDYFAEKMDREMDLVLEECGYSTL